MKGVRRLLPGGTAQGRSDSGPKKRKDIGLSTQSVKKHQRGGEKMSKQKSSKQNIYPEREDLRISRDREHLWGLTYERDK